MNPKPLYRYRDDNGHHVTLPYTPARVANDPNMAGLTYLPDHAAVDINGNSIPAKPNVALGRKRPVARLTKKTSPATASDEATEAAVSNTEAIKEATK